MSAQLGKQPARPDAQPFLSSDVELLRAVEQFIYREARLADEHEYDAWEALWTDDGEYWLPAGGPTDEPSGQMSVIHDNRARIATRVKQFHTGKRHSQTPPSSLRRLISNIELLDGADGCAPGRAGRLPNGDDGDTLAGANFIVVESRERGTQVWAGRVEYKLRDTEDGLRMAAKHVFLVDRDRALYTLAFLI